MWIRRTTGEIKRTRLRFLWRGSLTTSVICSCISVFYEALGYFGPVKGMGHALPMESVVGRLITVFVILFPISFFVGIVWIVFGRPLSNTIICNRCHKLERLNACEVCPCGGHYENSSYWKWVPDDTNAPIESVSVRKRLYLKLRTLVLDG